VKVGQSQVAASLKSTTLGWNRVCKACSACAPIAGWGPEKIEIESEFVSCIVMKS